MNNPAKELMNVMQSHPDVLDGIVDTNDVPAVLAERAYEYLRSYGDDLRTFEKDAFGYYCDSTDNVISIVPSKEGYKVRYSDNSEPVSNDVSSYAKGQKPQYSKSDQSIIEAGVTFEHARPVEFDFVRNPESAPDTGGQFGQDIEPVGRYLQHADTEHEVPGFEYGTVRFQKPYLISNSEDNIYGPKGWKARLSESYGGKTGSSLSKALAKDGFDAIITHHPDADSTSEIVDLTSFHKEDEEPDRYGMVMSDERGIDHPGKLEPKIDENLYPEKEDFFEESGVRGDYFDHEYHMSDENPDAMILDEDPTGHQDEGDLKTLYHGTASGEFPMHDRRFLGKPDRLLYGPGYYHTEDLGIAQKYMSKGSQSLETNFDVDYHGPKVIEELKEMAGDEEFVDGLSIGEKRRLKIASSVIKHLGKDAGFDGDEASVSRGSPAAAKAARKEIFKRLQLDIHGSSNRGQNKLSSELQKRVGYSSKYTKPTVHAVHLDIKNVFDADKDEIDFGDYLDYLVDRELIEDSDIDRLYKKYDSDGIQGLDMVDWDFVSDFLRDEQDEGELSPGFSVNQTLNHYLRKEGYDGITHIGGHIYGNKLHRVWIAFRPEQVKKVTNTNPTKDPRMDYSL